VDGPDIASYGANPPLFGTDFFQGPIKYIYDGTSIVDSVRLGMSAFLFYNNDFSVIGNPEVAAHFYGYLSGSWKDGSPFTFGGNGYGGSDPTPFMFPSDPSDATGWSECTEGNPPADRRYIQSSGPFRLEPGATNEVVVGAVWVRPPVSGGCQTTFEQISLADQKAQALFDADFDLIDGPDAPDVSIRELDGEIILSITNTGNSNNAGEKYEETDPIISSIASEDPSVEDTTYNFQ
ncbi:MAG TPA: T9SS C-terminal target domain-containing protein, partial [Bacteroidetes bacterium]|nr:T9SS C-terminal target domain-containing protein [Bacteroidota bacterium]